MPSGKVHDFIAVISIAPVFGMSYLSGLNIFESSILTAMAFFSQIMFGPDLDARSLQLKRWGFLSLIWLPYRFIFPHRSRFSHGLLFGPILRCVYLIFAFVIVVLGINFIIFKYCGLNLVKYLLPKLVIIFLSFNIKILMCIVIGFFVGGAVHTLTDKIFSFFKNLV